MGYDPFAGAIPSDLFLNDRDLDLINFFIVLPILHNTVYQKVVLKSLLLITHIVGHFPYLWRENTAIYP